MQQLVAILEGVASVEGGLMVQGHCRWVNDTILYNNVTEFVLSIGTNIADIRTTEW